jgi:hypothetical protein
VVGDYLGATIQVTELCIYLALLADWQAALVQWQPLGMLGVMAALPIIYSRQIVNFEC